jgi:hypothetical protein
MKIHSQHQKKKEKNHNVVQSSNERHIVSKQPTSIPNLVEPFIQRQQWHLLHSNTQTLVLSQTMFTLRTRYL